MFFPYLLIVFSAPNDVIKRKSEVTADIHIDFTGAPSYLVPTSGEMRAVTTVSLKRNSYTGTYSYVSYLYSSIIGIQMFD